MEKNNNNISVEASSVQVWFYNSHEKLDPIKSNSEELTCIWILWNKFRDSMVTYEVSRAARRRDVVGEKGGEHWPGRD